MTVVARSVEFANNADLIGWLLGMLDSYEFIRTLDWVRDLSRSSCSPSRYIGHRDHADGWRGLPRSPKKAVEIQNLSDVEETKTVYAGTPSSPLLPSLLPHARRSSARDEVVFRWSQDGRDF
jgi:hypothetical protein